MTLSITATATLDAQSEALLTRAAELEALWCTGSQLWFGTSGEPVTGTQVARHLDAALGAMERDGWMPGEFGLWQALDGPTDVKSVSISVLELVICAHTGASAAEPRLWDTVPGRTFDQVRALLQAGAAYARAHGPSAATTA
ncbi:hypothetical protein ACFY4K_33495 [Streptomyces leeuwenhoekii]|uniref:hypothetical protein n=1 Tax=Streptomyces leeuwenhoekii TaxID=1437453 RepID=UPI0036AC8CF8